MEALQPLGPVIIGDWLIWILMGSMPILILLSIKFGLQNYFMPDTTLRSLVIQLSLNLFCLLTVLLFWYAMSYQAPGPIAVKLGTGLSLLYAGLVLLDTVEAFKNYHPHKPKKHWICKPCQTENHGDHLQCWKCGRKKKIFKTRG